MPVADVSTAFRQAQLLELNQYARIELQLYIAWFTFFITAILTAMAWAIKTSLDEEWQVRFPLPVYMIYLLFAFQIVMGGFATKHVEKDFEIINARIEVIQGQLLTPSSPLFKQQVASTLPKGFLACVHLMELTLWSHLVFWGCVTAIIGYLARKASKAEASEAVPLRIPRTIKAMAPNAPGVEKRQAKSGSVAARGHGKVLHPVDAG